MRRREGGEGSPRSTMLSRLSLLLGDSRFLIGSVAGASVANGFTEAATLAVVAQVAASLVSGHKTVHAHIGLVHVNARVSSLIWVGLGLAVLRLLLQWPISTLPSQIAANVQEGLRTRLFRAFTNASWDTQSSDREGRLQETMTSQVSQASTGAEKATMLIISACSFVILLATAVVLSPPAAAVVFVIAVAMFFVLRPLRSVGSRRARALSKAQIEYAVGVAEANRLAEETQVFGVAQSQYKRVERLVEVCAKRLYRTLVIAKLIPNLYQSMIYVVLILGLAGLEISGAKHAGSLGAVVLILMRASQNGQAVQSAYQGLQQALPFIDRVVDAEDRYAASAVTDGGQPLSRVETVAFENVSFAYTPDRPVLSDITFAVEAGEAIGIVGPSGAGKSTLVQILLQLRPPRAGHYLINGEDVWHYARADWHRLVAYVPQEPRLLHASVADNIRFFREIDDEAVERAAKLARIHDDIMSWSAGYDTRVGPRADAVSGGQQQRLCLARALAARPQVLVLDEPTSALDPHSESLIQESLTALKSELTLFTIAHRMSTLDMCNRVMVILEGRLVAFDTRAVLQEENSYYRSASLLATGTGGMLVDES